MLWKQNDHKDYFKEVPTHENFTPFSSPATSTFTAVVSSAFFMTGSSIKAWTVITGWKQDEELTNKNTFIYLLNDENKCNNLTDGFINGETISKKDLGEWVSYIQRHI